MNAKIDVIGDLTYENGYNIINGIIEANCRKDVEKIVLWVSSGGGTPDIITPIWEIIKMCDKPIISIGSIRVCSTATAIFMMAKERILLPNTTFLLHKSGRANINSVSEDQLYKMYQDSVKTTDLLFEPVIANSSVSKEILEKMCFNKDWELTEEEVRQLGITTMNYNLDVVKPLIMN